MLDKLKKLFKIVNFAGTLQLKDGTEIQLDGGNLAVGVKCFVILPNVAEPVVLPDGSYTLEDESNMIIKDGLIAELNDAVAPEEVVEVEESEVVEQAEVEVEIPSEEPVDVPVEPTELEMKVKELEDRLKSIEDSLMSKQSEIEQSTQKLEEEFTSLKTKIENTDGAVRLSSNKKAVELTASDIRYNRLKGI